MRPKQPGQKKRKHKFVRHNWFRFSRLGMKWRYPKGHHSKMRQGRKSRPPMPNAGYGSPASVRGLVKGMKAVLVSNHEDLHKVNPKAGEAAVLASVLGKKKLLAIAAEAEKRGIKILNHRAVSSAMHFAHEMKKRPKEARSLESPKEAKAAAAAPKKEEKPSKQTEQVQKHAAKEASAAEKGHEEKGKAGEKTHHAAHEQKETGKAEGKSEQAKSEKAHAASHHTHQEKGKK
jgi:large subunit ribosomal protein L32e